MRFLRKTCVEQDGFSLLELLMAVVLIGLGMLALGNVMDKNSDSERKILPSTNT